MQTLMKTEPGRWPFGLTSVEELRAEKLHRESIIVDFMSQHPGGANIFKEYSPSLIQERLQLAPGMPGVGQAISLPYQLSMEGVSHLIRDWWNLSGLTLGTLSIPMGSSEAMSGPLRGYVELTQRVKKIPWLQLVTSASEIRQAKNEGRHALYGYWQPVYGLTNNLDDIDGAYEEGLRMLMLTYNRMDYVGTGCTERYDAGLSMYGIEVVKHCNRLGIIVDTSHCGKQTTLDACQFSSAPVFANHTSAQGLYNHARGKSDQELKAIADTGGVIGVVTVPYIISPNMKPTIDEVLDHIDYIANQVGWQHVGIGSDWPMQLPPELIETTLGSAIQEIGFRNEDNVSVTSVVRGFEDGRDMPNFTRGLVKRGYSDQQIKGILGENFMRVFEAVCG